VTEASERQADPVADRVTAKGDLRQSEANLRSILDVIDDAVILVDAEHRVVDLNEAARARIQRMASTTLQVGDVLTDVFTEAAFREHLQRAFAGEALAHERLVHLPSPTGGSYWVDVRMRPVFAEDGSVRAVVYRSADITERRASAVARERDVAFREALLGLLRQLLGRRFSEELYQLVLDHAVATVPGAEAGSILVQGRDDRYHYVASVGFDLSTLRSVSYAPGSLDGTTGAVEDHGTTLVRRGYRARSHDPTSRSTLLSAGRTGEIRSTLTAPIDVGGERLGYLNLDSFSSEGAFGADSRALASLLASAVGAALQRLRLEARLEDERSKLSHLANHDTLTNLPNRAMLTDRLEQALARGHRRERLTALMMIDLDGFKAVNDRFGHPAGDAVLREVARRLRSCVRAEDTVARLGGDEFAVVASELHRAEDAAQLAQTLLNVLEDPFDIADAQALIGASIGVSLAPGDAEEGAAMLQNADLALYRVKREGRGAVSFFTSGLDSRMRTRAALSDDLRSAVRSGEGIAVAYQPVVRLSDGTVIGVEALARWRHPQRGDVPPAVFVPLAEQAGFIGALGRMVLERCCHDLASWRRSGIGLSWRCAVNVSAQQLRSAVFAEETATVAAAHGLHLRDLEVEVTERTVMDEAGVALDNLQRLRAGGARVLIDDFGTGYSSLARLQQLPVDAVKIDQSFVRDLTADGAGAAIVAAVVSLARNLSLDTVAEGIETAAQQQALITLGCDVGQGFLLGRPLSARQVAASGAAARSETRVTET